MISENRWHHVVGTLNDATGMMSSYVDGQLVASQSYTDTVSNDRSYIYLGGFGSYFELLGQMDDIAVWNTPLSASEISLIYNRQKQKYSGTCTPKFQLGYNDTNTWYYFDGSNWVLTANSPVNTAQVNDQLTIGNNIFQFTKDVGVGALFIRVYILIFLLTSFSSQANEKCLKIEKPDQKTDIATYAFHGFKEVRNKNYKAATNHFLKGRLPSFADLARVGTLSIPIAEQAQPPRL